MNESVWIIVCLIYSTDLHSTAAQLPTTETLRNVTECDTNSNFNLTCGADEVLAIHSVQYAYNVSCETTCCNTYSSSDCFENGDTGDIQDIRRLCSGQSSCSIPSPKVNTAFSTCALAVKPISYIFLQYYCIPNSRTSSICATGNTLTSAGSPLYINNENYPGVTTGSASCSCSLEAYSCSSDINIYIIDADLYLDTSTCEQNLVFKNGTDSTLKTIGCGSYYTNSIITSSIGSHYSKIEFNNNSTANQEGYLFVGLVASEAGVSFSLSCTSEPETWCIGCGAPSNITDGKVELSEENNYAYGATATVSCANGYETSTPTISCPANGTWPDAVCTAKAACTANQWSCTNGDCIQNTSRCDNMPDCPDESDEKNCAVSVCPEGLEACPKPDGSSVCVPEKVKCDCGPVPVITNGDISLRDNSTIGSTADVTCNEGYIPSTPNVTCQNSGAWETASCSGVDCGTVPSVSFGSINLSDNGNTTFGATASVVCDSGYQANTTSVTCQSSGAWQSASCVIRDCSSVPTVQFGNVTLDSGITTFGSTASVTCESGYQPVKTPIECQASGQWETPLCEAQGTVTTTPTPTPGSASSTNLALIISLVIVGVILLMQLIAVSYFQCKIHAIRTKASDGDKEFPKRVLMIIMGSIPVFGLIPIYCSWKVFDREVYHVADKHHIDEFHDGAINTDNINDESRAVNSSNVLGNNSVQNNTYSDSNNMPLSNISAPVTNPLYGRNESNEIIGHDEAVIPDNIHMETPEQNAGSNELVNNNSTDQKRPKSNPSHGQNSTSRSSHGNEDDKGELTQDKNSEPSSSNNGLVNNNASDQNSSKSLSSETHGQNKQHQGIHGAMTRGISATFEDARDDMDIGRTPYLSQPKLPPISKPKHAHISKAKLPPIPQHPEEDDHHHHHFSIQVEQRRRQLQPVADRAIREGKHVEFVRDKLYINNCEYHPGNSNHHTHSSDKVRPNFY